MNEAFVIAGGGSAVKVAEAMTHLCAAGLGPERLHLLLVDGDALNGNLKRAVDTVACYQALQQWPWTAGVDGKPVRGFFSTDLRCYRLTEPIGGDAVVRKGLIGLYAKDRDIDPVMRLLFDHSELVNTFERGFYARPNVGCLLLADHINQFMAPTGVSRSDLGAKEFVQAMVEAAGRAESEQRVCPVVVVGSIFGGTGASLLPIADGCVKKAFKDRNSKHFDRLCWSRIMLLPYFSPSRAVDLVDPDRFLLDASGALMFYGNAEFPGPTYLLGSSNPGRNQVSPKSGGPEQANPAFFHEVLAALCARQFSLKPTRSSDVQILGTMDGGALNLGSLPNLCSGEEIEDLLHLLHLAAFFLRRGASENLGEHDMGLGEYIASFVDGKRADRASSALNTVPWFRQTMLDWARQLDKRELPRGSSAAQCAKVLLTSDQAEQYYIATKDTVLEYFARLLLWADGALNHPEEIQAIAFEQSVKYNYASLHSTMCRVKAPDVQADPPDNFVVRLCRVAMSAMELERQNRAARSDIPNFELLKEDSGCARLAVNVEHVRAQAADIAKQY